MRGWAKVAAAVVAVGMIVGGGPVYTVGSVHVYSLASDNSGWPSAPLVLFPCSLDAHPTTCQLDTGSDAEIMVSTATAAYAGMALGAPAGLLTTPIGSASASLVNARLSALGHSALVGGVATDTWQGPVLVSLNAMRALGFNFVGVNLGSGDLVTDTPAK